MTGRRRGSVISAVTALTLSTFGCAPDVPAAAVGVVVESNCSPAPVHGMGFVTIDGLVLTAAHIVAGYRSIEIAADQQSVSATVVAFDPNNDLAYLRPAEPLQHGWSLASIEDIDAVAPGTPGVAYVDRDGRTIQIDTTVVRRIQIETEDIYIDRDVVRPGWEVRYPIQSGDSGSALVVDGTIIGVMWARSRQADDRAYAIDPIVGGNLLNAQLAAGRLDVTPDIDVERC